MKSVFGFRVRLGNPDLDFENLNPDFPIERTLRFEKITFTFKFRPKLKCVRDRNTGSLFWNCPVYKKNCNSFKREKRFDGLASDYSQNKGYI